MWTILTWIFFPILSIKYGYLGTSIAALIVGLSSFVVWHLAFKYFKVNIFKTILHPLIASLLMLILLLPISALSISPLFSILVKIILAVIIYAVYQFIFNRVELLWFYQQFLQRKK
jgi:O-antigen/teichoic acid export membrane protein